MEHGGGRLVACEGVGVGRSMTAPETMEIEHGPKAVDTTGTRLRWC